MNSSTFFKSPAGQEAVLHSYDNLLAAWPVPHEDHMIPTRLGDTYVIRCGRESGPALILLHGSTSNSLTWGADVAELGRHVRVFAVDIPGEPGKSAPNRTAWDDPAWVEWLDDVLEGLQIDNTSLDGMSLGAWLGMQYAIARPDRVEKLVLLCPGGLAPMRVSFLLRSIPLALQGRRGAARMNRILFAGQPVDEAVNEFGYLVMKHFKGRTDPLPIFNDAELQHLAVPTMLIVGGKDAMLDSKKSLARMQANVSGLKAVLLPEAGHALPNQAGRFLSFLIGAGDDSGDD